MGKSDVSNPLGISMKHVSLITLTFQNSALILIMHYSRIMPTSSPHRYFASTAVLITEVIKLAVSLTIALYDALHTLPPNTPATVLFEQVYASVFSGDGWKLAIPATLYTLQNSLQYIAIGNLDAVHFQIMYQLKILTTALFSVLMLRRSLSSTKWFALILLTIGVAVVQLPTSDSSSYDPVTDDDLRWSFPRSVHELGQLANGAAEVAAELTKRGIAQLAEGLMRRSATYEGIQDDLGLGKPVMNPTLGTTCVIIAAIISGLTGVYFEKVLKDSSSSVSVWTRNVQLSFYSLFPALFIGVWFKDGEEIGKYGFWTGYNATVWTAIAFQALGGMLVALVIRDADNIAKNFATSISIILSLGFSVWVFDFEVTGNFILGTALVLFSTYLYNSSGESSSFARGIAAGILKGSRPPPIRIASYEKTTIDNGYTPKLERADPMDGLLGARENLGKSTSRPGTPVRHHSRVGSSRGKVKREE